MPPCEEQTAVFLEGDAALCIATADDGQRPSVGRAWGLLVERDTGTVRALVGEDRAAAANLVPGRRIAIVAADVATYRSVQVKGSIVAVTAPGPRERRAYDTYRHRFTAAIEAVGGTTPMDAVWPASIAVVSVVVDAFFDQTPGSGAGKRLPDTR